MENSFRFSGSTSCPGGCDPENILRYPLKMSTAFSVMFARMSLRFLSNVFAAAIQRQYTTSVWEWGFWWEDERTLFSDDAHNGVLVNELHRFQAALVNRCHYVDTAYPTLPVRRCVQ